MGGTPRPRRPRRLSSTDGYCGVVCDPCCGCPSMVRLSAAASQIRPSFCITAQTPVQPCAQQRAVRSLAHLRQRIAKGYLKRGERPYNLQPDFHCLTADIEYLSQVVNDCCFTSCALSHARAELAQKQRFRH